MSEELSIEAWFERIEAVVAELESGELPLEQALERYEAGLHGVRQARALLESYGERLEALRAQDPPVDDDEA